MQIITFVPATFPNIPPLKTLSASICCHGDGSSDELLWSSKRQELVELEERVCRLGVHGAGDHELNRVISDGALPGE